MKHQPDSDRIYNLYGGVFFAQFTRLALLMDIFSPLVDGPLTAAQVGAACQISEPGAKSLLDYMAATEVLTFDPEAESYALTPSAAAFLVPTSRTYAGDWVLANTDPDLYDRMAQTIRAGQPAGYTLPWAQDAWLESYSPSRIESSLQMWQTVGLNPPADRPFRFLDLASGCGIKTMALAQAHATVEVTCLDSEEVLAVARDLAGRLGLAGRVHYLAADLLSDDFGDSAFDAALLGLITYILTPAQNQSVFRRACRALKPDGVLVIDAIMTTARPKEWASRATLLMRTWNGGAAHSFEQYREWLLAAGFSTVHRHSEQLLSARRSADAA